MPVSVLRHRLCRASSILALMVGLCGGLGLSSVQAAEATVVANELNGYGRFVFTLDKRVKAQVRSSSGIIVVSFDEPVTIDIEKLAAQVPSYISVARKDPDGRSIRFATTRTLKPNLLEAGEKLFLDLLPEGWQGLPPSLPQEIVEQLAKRAQDAEEQLRKAQREREKREPRDLTARVGNGPNFSRLIFDIGQTVPVEMKRDGDQLTLVFDAALRFDPASVKAMLPEGVQSFTAESKGGILKVMIAVAAKTEMRSFREDDTVVIDFPKPREAARESDIALPSLAGPVAPEKPSSGQEKAAADKAQAAKADVPKAQISPPAIKALAESSINIRPSIQRVGDGVQVKVPFANAMPAAAFLRNDTLWMIFDTKQVVDAIPVPEDLKSDIARIDVDRAAGASILRVTLQNPQAVSFNPGENGNGWTASIGKTAAQPTESFLLRRGVADNGRPILTAKFAALGQIFWIDDPDTEDRLGIVTAQGPAFGLPKTQSFVELTALPTAHGLVISPRSDDVVVGIGLDEVRISRENGLTLSVGIADSRAAVTEGGKDLLLDVEAWQKATKGNIRERGNELLRNAADALKKNKTEARLALAQFRLATGDVVEASGILKVIEQDDPTAMAGKPMLLLRAITAVNTDQGKEAMRLLNDPAIGLEMEAALWRGVLDANNRRWTKALIGFRQSLEALERYPDELQVKIRNLVVIAAIENNDTAFASQQLDLYEQQKGRDGDPAEIALLRARTAEQIGRIDDALSAYERATRSKDRGIEAEARLDRVMLRHKENRITRDEVMVELETIKVIWRRGEIEVRALAMLGEMYAEDNRWRDAFNAARRATEIMPDHPMARQLHDAMAKRFEELFLEGKADQLSKVEAVGLFYDFRSLMPISRRGDEIVRRLADRLADLDLLDQATELLQHQVDNRLGGLMRARVAARLAVLHLLNRKPAEAVQTLKATRSNELPDDVRRGRLLLEARALSELSRNDLALEILGANKGDDVERLRADVMWRSKRWREAGEAFEKVLGDRWQGANVLSDAERIDVMRASISYVLADDRLGMDRLRQKFAPKMANSVDARPFALVSGDSRNRQKEFRDIARNVVAEDTLSEFLNVYRQRYPEAAGAPRNPKAAEDAIKENQPQTGRPG